MGQMSMLPLRDYLSIEYRGSGYWTVSAVIGDRLVHVMCDYKPTIGEAEELLIARYNY